METKKSEGTKVTKIEAKFISILSGLPVEAKEGEKVLKVQAKELEYENRKYFGYNVIKKNGDKLNLKFVKVAKNIPLSEGTHYILVLESDVNIDTWSKVYPVMWCKNVIDLLHMENTGRKEQSKESLKDF